jgi:hypothetical protein
MNLRAWAVALLVLLGCRTLAQQPAWSFGVRGGYGFLVAHHDNLKRMVEGHIPSAEIFYERVVSGKRDWHHRYKFPTWGVGFLTADLRADELGNAFRLTPYLLLPLSFSEKGTLDLRFGWGIGVVTRPFDRESNYKGHAIGSTMNVNMPLALEYRRLFGRTWVGVGLGIDHLSNGAYTVPNLGINVPSVQVSVRHGFGERAAPDTTQRIGPLERSTRMVALATMGIKETFPVNSGKHFCYALVVAGIKPVGGKIALEGGLDIFHNTALAQRAERLNEPVPDPLTQVGLHVGGGLLLNKLTVIWQAGAYVFNAFPDDGVIFNRIGFRHALGKHWLVNFTLKTHLATADHFELGFGYRFL